ATIVDPNVPYLGNTLCFRDEESIKKYKSFTVKVHSYGCKIIPQITHPGPESISAFFGVAPEASSSYPNSMGQMTRELAKEELPGIVALYAKAAKNAKEAGD
ncbi:NADH-dependent flavin oxidoreductase, partial [[Ruminococcus] torques]|nr:NADH-dependent flavin oxidoreductase [[Ruminococcus] torques]